MIRFISDILNEHDILNVHFYICLNNMLTGHWLMIILNIYIKFRLIFFTQDEIHWWSKYQNHRCSLSEQKKEFAISGLMECSNYCIPCENRSNAYYIIPGFNIYVKELHTRLRFKRALKHCKLIEESVRADAMSNSLQQYDSFSFIKHVHN